MKPYIYSPPKHRQRGPINWDGVIFYICVFGSGLIMLTGILIILAALLSDSVETYFP